MKCPICNGKGYQFVADYDGMYDIVCEQCKGKGEVDENGKPIFTNEEWLKSLGTEQLAEEIVNMTLLDVYKLYDRMESAEYDIGIGVGAKKVIVEWLKQPHTIKG